MEEGGKAKQEHTKRIRGGKTITGSPDRPRNPKRRKVPYRISEHTGGSLQKNFTKKPAAVN